MLTQPSGKPYRPIIAQTRSLARSGFTVLRWWAAVAWAVGGVGCIIAGPIVLSRGDGGGIALIGGGVILVALAWLIHPWGLQRGKRRER